MIVIQQPLGISSPKPGILEIIFDRRTAQDDNRGLGQPVRDNRYTIMNFDFLHKMGNVQKLRETSHRLLHPFARFETKDLPTTDSGTVSATQKSSEQCQFNLGGVFLAPHFDEYPQDTDHKSTIILMSSAERSSCEAVSCKWAAQSFEKIFKITNSIAKRLTLRASSFLGYDMEVTDTAPIQAFTLT